MEEENTYNSRNVSFRIKPVAGGNTPGKDGQYKRDNDTQALNT